MKKQMLNGDWKLKKYPDGKSIPVKVPGSVISGLLAAGEIEDPYYRENEYDTRELFWNDYEFSRKFSVDRELIQEKEVELVCEGLDTLAEIRLNGIPVAHTANMHRTYRIAAGNFLFEGENEIAIRFSSVLQYIKNYKYRENHEVHYIPSGAMEGNHLLRKAHSMFGWDWGPQLVDAGILRDIYLEGRSGGRIADVRIHQKHKEDGSVGVVVAVELEHATEDREITVTFAEPEGGQFWKENAQKVSDVFYAAEFTVENPRLWWPNGYGAQPLYTLTVTRDGEQVAKKIGLRTLTVSQQKDEWGNEFAFMVNGVKIFARGGNYIPEDAVYPHITEEKIKRLLGDCVRANFNCIRVWGGGYYPLDAFYDLCDSFGLIVWQDLMYACNVYDVTDEFLKNVKKETVDNVKRIRHHACLGLWCGNNEIESAWDHWGDFQSESAYLRADYIRLFEEVLPRTVKSVDPDTFYWHSSPSSGGCFDSPDDENRGDTHYWAVWHGQQPFTDYQKYFFRFCSEFGFQSFPCRKTVESYTKESDRNIFSRVMESHQKNTSANGKMLYYLSENFRYPKDFDSLLYVTQVLQGIAVKSGVDHWRRNRGRCMGALYWQVNDNWPVASWSGIDYFGRWKALHYMAVKFYAPVSGSIRAANAELCLVNETAAEISYSGSFVCRDLDGNILEEIPVTGQLAAYSAQKAGELSAARTYESFVEAEIKCSDGTEIHEVEVLAPYKHLELKKPKYRVQVTEEADRFVIRLGADCFAPFVELDFTDADVVFSDNFFALNGAGEKMIVVLKQDIRKGSFADADDLKNRLVIRSLRDTY